MKNGGCNNTNINKQLLPAQNTLSEDSDIDVGILKSDMDL